MYACMYNVCVISCNNLMVLTAYMCMSIMTLGLLCNNTTYHMVLHVGSGCSKCLILLFLIYRRPFFNLLNKKLSTGGKACRLFSPHPHPAMSHA